MTDNHSTYQDNNTNFMDNKDKKLSGTENEFEEKMRNCMNHRRKKCLKESIENNHLFLFIAYSKLRDTATSLSNGVKRRKKFTTCLLQIKIYHYLFNQ